MPSQNAAALDSKRDHTRQAPKSPNRVVAEAEAQWLFSEAEMANTPSIQDGMSQKEEEELRTKGVNFIVQVGILLKLPQLTLSTAAVFFQRFLMRASLKKARNGVPKLHHYQAAATALFLATKVEESCRKMKDLVQACCRIAQKNPNLVIDEQSKDFWRWRDCILDNEDVLLEILCFDLTIESPHRQLFDMLKYYKLEHNKRLRNAAWGFVTDSNNTLLCLLCSSRGIAAAALHAASAFCDVEIPDDSKGRPWWDTQHVNLSEVRQAVLYMKNHFQDAQGSSSANGSTSVEPSEGDQSIYANLNPPSAKPAVNGEAPHNPAPDGLQASDGAVSERRRSHDSAAGVKRAHHDIEERAEDKDLLDKRQRRNVNATDSTTASADKRGQSPSLDIKHEEALRVESGNAQSQAAVEGDEGMEEGELQE